MSQYETIIQHPYTKQKILVRASNRYLLDERIQKQVERWQREHEKQIEFTEVSELKRKAHKLTIQAEEELTAIRHILSTTLDINDAIDWSKLKSKKSFSKSEPVLQHYLNQIPVYLGLELFIAYFANKKDAAEKDLKAQYATDLNRYKEEKQKFEQDQLEHNNQIDLLQKNYEEGNTDSVIEYLKMVLEKSNYPSSIILEHDLTLLLESKTLIIDLTLPHPNDLPKVFEYTYVASKKLILEKELKAKDKDKMYNDAIYQICLRTIHEILESDYKHHIDLVVINGLVNGSDPKTGLPFTNYIISLQADREVFEKLNLKSVDPKECFRHLKGVSAGDFVLLTPVKPIMRLNKEDERIIKADSIVDNYNETTNLATIEWKDFEILVRDLIQKEFAREGCTVEVTRASKDAGVDAIAFDEDPIRGGKYVIQAKRYNNLVPLTAVRDLFGTVHNEGAVKGILITTSYYGKDSLEFVKDKPLTLINGEQLLYMFQKHGYDFKIELKNKKKAETKYSH